MPLSAPAIFSACKRATEIEEVVLDARRAEHLGHRSSLHASSSASRPTSMSAHNSSEQAG
jgi:hypothetical protein